MEVGKTDTEGGPVVGREHREEVVDRGTVSTTHKRATDKVNKATDSWVGQIIHKHTHIHTSQHNVKNTRNRGKRQIKREKKRVV